MKYSVTIETEWESGSFRQSTTRERSDAATAFFVAIRDSNLFCSSETLEPFLADLILRLSDTLAEDDKFLPEFVSGAHCVMAACKRRNS